MIVGAVTLVSAVVSFFVTLFATGKWGVPLYPAPTSSDRLQLSLEVGAIFAAIVLALMLAWEKGTGGPAFILIAAMIAVLVCAGVILWPSPEVVSRPVLASKDWQDSGVRIGPGDRVEITASGKWYPFGAARPIGPEGCSHLEGCSEDPKQSANICCMAHAGLIGKVGDGEPFAIGKDMIYNSGAKGMLFLRINDKVLNDNSGEINATIKRLNES